MFVIDRHRGFCLVSGMAKEKSNEIVSEEAEMERRFQALEDNAKESNDTLKKLAAKLLGETPPPPKPKGNNESNPPAPTATGAKKFFQDLGILAKD